MASVSTSNLSIDDNNNNNNDDHNTNTSQSHFQKTVYLQDWWLIKAEKDFEGRRLAVAGLASGPSLEQQALRVFTSAPILKRYDVFTLKTVDGIYVIIKGFINKDRTKENGFPSEVFNHFVFGFPPYWEDYAEKYLGEGSTTEAVSRSNLGLNKSPTHSDSGEKTPNKNKKAINEERHDNSDRMEGLEDCGNMLSANGQHNLNDDACNESLVEVLKVCSSQVVSEMIAGDASKGPNLQNNVKEAIYPKKNVKEASSSRKKSKRKLAYESPITRGGKEKTSAVSPGSLSFKRSRSGRLLLPTLEFWRNQTAIYDAERHITGIQDGLHVIEPSRGSRSEPQRKRKQLT
uniref:SANTA domain-containing protein n=1 Tax=Davidia involucrata TaxID=16924 RepID=A0A5B7BPE9_DAVIN